jgi:hypothetical protein
MSQFLIVWRYKDENRIFHNTVKAKHRSDALRRFEPSHMEQVIEVRPAR